MAVRLKETAVPINHNTYTGSNTICKIKLRGKIEAPKVTLPFARPVKIKYQSVQGVTINMIKPICKSISPARNLFDNARVMRGLMIKLMTKAAMENRTFKNDFEISFISTVRNTKNNMNIKNISIHLPACSSIKGLVFPRAIPKNADTMIKTGCSFDKILI
jgi:hypothetical protein